MKCSFSNTFRELSITILLDTTTLFIIPFFSYLMKLAGQTGFDEHDLSPLLLGLLGFIGFIGFVGFFELIGLIRFIELRV